MVDLPRPDGPCTPRMPCAGIFSDRSRKHASRMVPQRMPRRSACALVKVGIGVGAVSRHLVGIRETHMIQGHAVVRRRHRAGFLHGRNLVHQREQPPRGGEGLGQARRQCAQCQRRAEGAGGISTTAANNSPTPPTAASPYQASTRANAPASAVASTTITPPMPPNRPLFRLSLTR